MDRKLMLGAVAALSLGATMVGAFGADTHPMPKRHHHRKAEPELAGRSKKKFKGSKAAKRAARRHK